MKTGTNIIRCKVVSSEYVLSKSTQIVPAHSALAFIVNTFARLLNDCRCQPAIEFIWVRHATAHRPLRQKQAPLSEEIGGRGRALVCTVGRFRATRVSCSSHLLCPNALERDRPRTRLTRWRGRSGVRRGEEEEAISLSFFYWYTHIIGCCMSFCPPVHS